MRTISLMTDIFWNSTRLFRIALTTCVALALALVVHLVYFPYAVSLLNTGDFPGFYVQAVMIKLGFLHNLYNFEMQRQLENEFWPAMQGMYYPSAYPPYTALLLSPLALFEHQAAQNLFLGCMLLFYGISFHYLKEINASFENKTFSLAIILLLFSPIFCGLFGAQNTALSLLLATLSSLLFFQKRHSERMLAGILCGIWFIKPQYGLLFAAGLFVIRPDRWFVLGLCTTLSLLWAVTASVFGVGWIPWWFNQIRFFDAYNLSVNIQESVSLRGFVTLFSESVLSGWIITLLACAGLFSLLIAGSRKGLEERRLVSVLLGLMPLVAPQTLFYDLSLGLLGYLLVCNCNTDRGIRNIWMLVIFGALLYPLRESNFPMPFFTLSVILAGLVVYENFSFQAKKT